MPFSLPKKLALALGCCLFLLACAPEHQYRAQPIRSANAYANRKDVQGAIIAAEAIYDDRLLTERFGYNLKKAGVIPVNLIIQNNGDNVLVLMPGTEMKDENGADWDVLPQDRVIRRVADYTRGGVSTKEGVGRTLKGAIAGAVLGAAVGVATGSNVGSAAGKGAAIGGALGVSSSVLGMGGKDNTAEVAQDYSSLALQQSSVGPGESVHGFLFFPSFPSEASRPVLLTLKVRSGQGKTQTVSLQL
ncbi:MAG: hypothetical protein LBR11_12630 [Deltaproteobacteria bacterium]|jgi:hypothetical protein|nr:hypothetical protein [Deltaproteobacteria bacterium]